MIALNAQKPILPNIKPLKTCFWLVQLPSGPLKSQNVPLSLVPGLVWRLFHWYEGNPKREFRCPKSGSQRFIYFLELFKQLISCSVQPMPFGLLFLWCVGNLSHVKSPPPFFFCRKQWNTVERAQGLSQFFLKSSVTFLPVTLDVPVWFLVSLCKIRLVIPHGIAREI